MHAKTHYDVGVVLYPNDHQCLQKCTASYIALHHLTRQSEMANTSPRHMPVLGNVHPIKIEIKLYLFRDVISLIARVFIFLIDRATQEVPIKNI